MVANAWVATNAPAHVFDIHFQPFGKVGDLVHKAYFGREHGVGSVFGQLGGPYAHKHQFFVVAIVGGVALLHTHFHPLAFRADNNACATGKIFNRRPFLHKLRVGANVKGE